MVAKNAHPEKTFSEGYTDGWQQASGSNMLPAIPAHAIPSGYTPYGWGYETGYTDGKR